MTRDWRDFLNALTYCHGCGRFGLPARTSAGTRGRAPAGWKMLYQPHADAPPMLLACGDPCATRVRAAMDVGPVREPLETAADFIMSTELREKMMAEFRQYLRDQLEEDLPAANDPPDRRPP